MRLRDGPAAQHLWGEAAPQQQSRIELLRQAAAGAAQTALLLT
ncbi:hypothetical protein CTATCC11996_10583 [Comamonas testosteroni ATCC 11996]|nr:hypothetical protein CTATCC11996_10583 [Comamonas testosteroni ATCC 11996]